VKCFLEAMTTSDSSTQIFPSPSSVPFVTITFHDNIQLGIAYYDICQVTFQIFEKQLLENCSFLLLITFVFLATDTNCSPSIEISKKFDGTPLQTIFER
jgi:hypothetical protein